MSNPYVEMTFSEALECFIAGCQEIINEDKYGKDNTLVVRNYDAKKFIAIDNSTGSVYCFVARVDGYSKALGDYKVGDVLKSASYKTPAKGARGNIFFPDNGLSRMGVYGAEYNDAYGKAQAKQRKAS